LDSLIFKCAFWDWKCSF